MVQALAHDHRRNARRKLPAGTQGDDPRSVRQAAFSRSHFVTSSYSKTSAAAPWRRRSPGITNFTRSMLRFKRPLRAARIRGETEEWHDPPDGYRSSKQPGGRPGDRRVGVVWHTQGSGKSLTMAFYAGRVILEPEMANPTLVILTDRNDLDDQLFGTFSRCQELLRQPPVQAESRADMRAKLKSTPAV